ncbi:MAG TPA: hypothetical protein VIR79_06980 [Nitrospira sp.]
MDNFIPILSLVVAALAVFFGPFISLKIAKRQVRSSLEVANRQITGPMRQAWINSLRDLLSELCSSAHHYFVAGFEDRKDDEYQRLGHLETKIQLMLNAKEDDHIQLERLIREMVSSLEKGKDGDAEFTAVHRKVIALSRQVLKREWNVVKQPIAVE